MHAAGILIAQVGRIAEAPSPRLRRGECRLCPLRDHLPLGLGDNSHDTDHQFVRFRHVGGQLPLPAIQKILDRLALRIEAKACRLRSGGRR
jgi:hypothetical protein